MNMLRLIIWITSGIATIAMLLIIVATLALGADRSPGADLGTLPGQVADIPPAMLAIYATAGKQSGVDWAVLAAIGKVESDHNRSTAAGVHSGINFAGCCAGSMQISLAGGASSTWSRYKVDGNHDGATSIYDPADAVPAARCIPEGSRRTGRLPARDLCIQAMHNGTSTKCSASPPAIAR